MWNAMVRDRALLFTEIGGGVALLFPEGAGAVAAAAAAAGSSGAPSLAVTLGKACGGIRVKLLSETAEFNASPGTTVMVTAWRCRLRQFWLGAPHRVNGDKDSPVEVRAVKHGGVASGNRGSRKAVEVERGVDGLRHGGREERLGVREACEGEQEAETS